MRANKPSALTERKFNRSCCCRCTQNAQNKQSSATDKDAVMRLNQRRDVEVRERQSEKRHRTVETERGPRHEKPRPKTSRDESRDSVADNYTVNDGCGACRVVEVSGPSTSGRQETEVTTTTATVTATRPACGRYRSTRRRTTDRQPATTRAVRRRSPPPSATERVATRMPEWCVALYLVLLSSLPTLCLRK